MTKRKLSRQDSISGMTLADLSKFFSGNEAITKAVKQIRNQIDDPKEKKLKGTYSSYFTRERKDGTKVYVSQVYFGRDANGRKIVRTAKADTFEESQNLAKELRELQQATNEVPKSYHDLLVEKKEEPTLSEFLNDYLESRTMELSRNTIQSYKNKLKYLHKLGDIKVTSVTNKDILKLIKSMVDKGLSERTIKSFHTNLNTAFKYGMTHGIMTHNPLQLIKPPRVRKSEIWALTKDELNHLLEKAQGTKLEVFIYIAALTGMRKEELRALTWRDITFDTGQDDTATISVNSAMTTINGYGDDDHETKTPSSNRSIPLSKNHPIITRLKAMYEELIQARKEIAIKDRPKKDYVFGYIDGSPWGDSLIYKSWHKLRKDCGFVTEDQGLRIHDLRHTHATLALMSGEPTILVSRRLGHSSIATTVDLYGHVIPSDSKHWVTQFVKNVLPEETSKPVITRVS